MKFLTIKYLITKRNKAVFCWEIVFLVSVESKKIKLLDVDSCGHVGKEEDKSKIVLVFDEIVTTIKFAKFTVLNTHQNVREGQLVSFKLGIIYSSV